MKQITDKLNKIAKAIDPSVEVPSTDLIIDSLDAITKAYGGTPTESNLIVDKLEDIADGLESGGGGQKPTGTIEITENGTYDVKQYASADVNVSGGGGGSSEVIPEQTVTFETTEMGTTAELSGVTLDPENPVEAIELTITLEGTSHTQILNYHPVDDQAGYFGDFSLGVAYVDDKWLLITFEPDVPALTVSAKRVEEAANQFNIRTLEVVFSDEVVEDLEELEIAIIGCFYDSETNSFYTKQYVSLYDAVGLTVSIAIPVDSSMTAYVEKLTSGNYDVDMEGNATYDSDSGGYIITGDCVVNISTGK